VWRVCGAVSFCPLSLVLLLISFLSFPSFCALLLSGGRVDDNELGRQLGKGKNSVPPSPYIGKMRVWSNKKKIWRHTILSFSCLPSRPEGRAQRQHPPFRQTVKKTHRTKGNETQTHKTKGNKTQASTTTKQNTHHNTTKESTRKRRQEPAGPYSARSTALSASPASTTSSSSSSLSQLSPTGGAAREILR